MGVLALLFFIATNFMVVMSWYCCSKLVKREMRVIGFFWTLILYVVGFSAMVTMLANHKGGTIWISMFVTVAIITTFQWVLGVREWRRTAGMLVMNGLVVYFWMSGAYSWAFLFGWV